MHDCPRRKGDLEQVDECRQQVSNMFHVSVPVCILSTRVRGVPPPVSLPPVCPLPSPVPPFAQKTKNEIDGRWAEWSG